MKIYISPKAEFKPFACEDVIASSGVVNNPLTRLEKVNFANSQANVSWNDKVGK